MPAHTRAPYRSWAKTIAILFAAVVIVVIVIAMFDGPGDAAHDAAVDQGKTDGATIGRDAYNSGLAITRGDLEQRCRDTFESNQRFDENPLSYDVQDVYIDACVEAAEIVD